MKKTGIFFVITAILLFAVLFSLPAQAKYADFKQVLREVIGITHTFTENMEAADSAEEVADALVAYATAMEALEPRMDALDEKYPDITPENYPVELAEIMVEYEEMIMDMQIAMQTIWEYMTDPAVQDALEKMQ